MGQAVAAVAVLVSLAAVYGQLQQNNKIARADLTHSVWLQAGALWHTLFDTPEKAELMHSATAPLTDAEKLRMHTSLAIILGVHEAAFTLRQRRLIQPSSYNTLEAMLRLYLPSPLVQKFWARLTKDGKDPASVTLVDGAIAQINQSARASGAQGGPT